MGWRSATWARWLGWTALFGVGLFAWEAYFFSQFYLPEERGGAILFWAVSLGIAFLAFGIGVRFRSWSWVAGPLVADLLVSIAVLGIHEWPEQAGLALVLLFYFYLLLAVPAALGVWWGKRRKAASTAPPVAGPGADASMQLRH